MDTLVVVHGKSEVMLCRRISQLLRMPMEILSRKGGEESILISRLPEYLSERPFDSELSLHKQYPAFEYMPRKDTSMPNLRIFTIMDVDMDSHLLKRYLSKDLFQGVLFQDRIVPIFSNPNLDSVMDEIGYGSVVSKKIRSYSKMMDQITDPLDFYMRLSKCDSTNLDLFVRHCLSRSPPYQSRLPPVRVRIKQSLVWL